MTDSPTSTSAPRLDAIHMYQQGRDDASVGYEIDERFSVHSEAAQQLWWAYEEGWKDWHGGHNC